ncbi:MAG: hypothetical protein IPM83_11470 [Ignavibacteria bacterium]|nr:hypothetical protein [Ignavibacteria bacterium]
MSLLIRSNRMQRSLLAAFVLILGCAVPVFSQRDPLKADEEAGKAIEYMDANLPENAIEAWDRALKFMPGLYALPLRESCELGDGQALSGCSYDPATDLYRHVAQGTGLSVDGELSRLYAGHCLVQSRLPCGLAAYPRSGRLHFEMGQQYYVAYDRARANVWWLKGTQAEPTFPTNYYWLARSYSETRDLIWAVFYGEAFLNLERTTPRTRDMSRLLYETWNRSMKLGDSNDPINFCSDSLLDVPSPLGAQQMSFPVAFEYNIALAAQPFIPKDSILPRLSIEKLIDLRYKFMRAWSQAGYDKTYPNDILSWNKRLQEQGD